MALPGTIQAAPDGALGFDANSVISLDAAGAFVDQGYEFCIRYLSRDIGFGEHDLTPAEAGDILAAGLGLMAVQHVRKQPWSPTAALGQSDGTNAGINAGAIGFPPGVNVWCDLEGIDLGADTGDVIGYCSAWFTAVAAAGFVPGIYIGDDVILDGQQLFDLPFQHYWKSASRVPEIPTRGYQMTQTLFSGTIAGISIDQDTTQTDGLGGQALWLIDESS
jgi:hypothetical protein